MKKIFTTLTVTIISIYLIAQAPQKMSYQAVIRNNSDQLISNASIGNKISILQGTSTGTAVYVETQVVTSNANGLVSLEIGAGTVVSGSFETINWAAGPYFIKTETDPTGGTNYTITGVSEVLSVPYALYADKAGNGFSGNYSDLSNKPVLFDGQYNSLTGLPNFSTVATSGNYNDLTNKPVIFDGNYSNLTNKPAIKDSVTTYGFSGNYNDLSNKPALFDGNYTSLLNKPSIKDTVTTYANGSETKLSAGTNISVTGSGTVASPYVINATPAAHYIGELFGGGIIFWLSPDKLHGLIMSLDDINSSIFWSNDTITEIGGASELYDGLANTEAIIAVTDVEINAARVCYDYTNDGFNDWYLPATWQILEIFRNAYTLNYVLANDGNGATVPLISNQDDMSAPYPYYWSSTEYSASKAWQQYFHHGAADYFNKRSTLRVRAVRNF